MGFSQYPPNGETAAEIANVPAGNISATDVQSAINELDTEKLGTAAAASTYAQIAGSASEVFSVGTATAAAHAVRADQNVNDLTSVSASIATGFLTLGLQPCVIRFRNSDVTNGAPNTKFVTAAQSLATDNIGASFGLTTGVQGRLILIDIDDGTATPVLGVINQSGGVDLSEEGVLTSTTAITGAVTSATTVYTTVALGAGLYPYKVVGAVDIVWTSGSGYVTTPVKVIGAGGNALTSMSSLGYGQTWQAVTRTSGTTYYNTTGRPITVVYTAVWTTASIVVGGVAIASPATTQSIALTFIVPPNKSYTVTTAGTVAGCAELR